MGAGTGERAGGIYSLLQLLPLVMVVSLVSAVGHYFENEEEAVVAGSGRELSRRFMAYKRRERSGVRDGAEYT
jgi:hypothetical protein